MCHSNNDSVIMNAPPNVAACDSPKSASRSCAKCQQQQQQQNQRRQKRIVSTTTETLETSFLDVFRNLKQEMKVQTGLTEVPQRVLRQHVEPILESLKVIDAEVLLDLERAEADTGAALQPGVTIRPIHAQIKPPVQPGCGTVTDHPDTTVVRYLHLSECPEQYSVGIFVFPPYARMPLHDHPGMCVLSRVLYGSLERTSLDLAPIHNDDFTDDNNGDASSTRDATATALSEKENKEQQQMKRSRSSSSMLDSLWQKMPWKRYSRDCDSPDGPTPQRPDIPESSRRAYRKRVDYLQAPQCTALFPLEGNLHQFQAGPHGAAVLDVLLPPYDSDHRDCNYYDIVDEPETTASSSSTPRCWIVPRAKPENFHCLAGRYGHVGCAD